MARGQIKIKRDGRKSGCSDELILGGMNNANENGVQKTTWHGEKIDLVAFCKKFNGPEPNRGPYHGGRACK